MVKRYIQKINEKSLVIMCILVSIYIIISFTSYNYTEDLSLKEYLTVMINSAIFIFMITRLYKIVRKYCSELYAVIAILFLSFTTNMIHNYILRTDSPFLIFLLPSSYFYLKNSKRKLIDIIITICLVIISYQVSALITIIFIPLLLSLIIKRVRIYFLSYLAIIVYLIYELYNIGLNNSLLYLISLYFTNISYNSIVKEPVITYNFVIVFSIFGLYYFRNKNKWIFTNFLLSLIMMILAEPLIYLLYDVSNIKIIDIYMPLIMMMSIIGIWHINKGMKYKLTEKRT